MATVSMIRVDIEQRPIFFFSDGTSLEFHDLESLIPYMNDVSNVDNTKIICIAYLLARSPDLSNTASVLNKDFIFDLSSPSPIRVQ